MNSSAHTSVRDSVIHFLSFHLRILILPVLFTSGMCAQSINFVQVNSSVANSASSLTATFGSAQVAGDLNIVAIGWSDATNTVTLVSDSKGNSYRLAVSYASASLGMTLAIYYAPNITAAAGGTNTVTVKLSGTASYPDLRITEYSGVATLDKTSSAGGTSATANSGAVTTTSASELLFGTNYTYGTTNAPGSGYTSRLITNNGDIVEDQIVSSTGTYSATAAMSGANWIMQLATFSSASGGGTPPPAPTNLTASAASSSQINLNWTASSGATSYNVLRSTTSGGSYTQIASGVTTTAYSNTGLAASTTYYYVVQAVNSAGTSGNSNQASATTNAAAISVSVSPTTATLNAGGTQSFTATVNNDSANQGVTWSVSCASSPCGSVSPTTTASGVATTYTAPSPSNNLSVTVTATSVSDPTKSASASVTVTGTNSANAYYVSTSGSDTSGAGTLSSPWRTIQYAVNTVTVPGSTIYVRGGVYNEHVSMPNSGSASSGVITLQSYPGELATLDGTGLTVGSGGYAYGLLDIVNQSYVTVSGMEIRNFTGSGKGQVPAGIHVEGSGSNIQILNNHIHNITVQGNSCTSTNGFGLIVVGTNGAAPLTYITISGNELDHMVTGCSETMTVNGNLQFFTISNNKVHDNNNIGIAALGGEGVASGYTQYNGSPNDQARNGTISGNTVYNITSNNNPVYKGACNCADGIYLDGSAHVTVERNVVHNVDINEVAGEGAGQNTDSNIVRNNLFYSNGVTGLSIGGQTKVGGASNVTVVNNTFYGNGTYGGNVALGEFTTGINLTGTNIFKNNILYAGSTGLLLKAVTTSTISLDYNLYYSSASPSWIWGSNTYTTFSSYASGTGEDAHSLFADPQFLNLTTTPPNLDIASTSPANEAGINLGSSVVGTVDFAGNPRVVGNIDIGAYEH